MIKKKATNTISALLLVTRLWQGGVLGFLRHCSGDSIVPFFSDTVHDVACLAIRSHRLYSLVHVRVRDRLTINSASSVCHIVYAILINCAVDAGERVLAAQGARDASNGPQARNTSRTLLASATKGTLSHCIRLVTGEYHRLFELVARFGLSDGDIHSFDLTELGIFQYKIV